LLETLPEQDLVWGGDFNHALEGREYAGGIGGRRSLMSALEALGLTAPTSQLPHQIDTLRSIDHVAVPRSWVVTSAERISAVAEAGRLSDHDAYVVDVQP
jgi:endonuclease/exonuclease/phosphatase family metal-dependent hydrolase